MQVIKITLLSLVGCLMYGQSSTSNVWKQIFTNQTTTGASSNVKNTGQAFHIMYGAVTGTVACAASDTRLQLEGSFDNTTFTAISKVVEADAGVAGLRGAILVVGNGSYPFVRARILTIGSTCIINAYYSGQLNTQSFNTSLLTKSNGLKMVTFNTDFIGPGFPEYSTIVNATTLNLGTEGKMVIGFLDFWTTGGARLDFTEHSSGTCTSGNQTGFIYQLRDSSVGSKGKTLQYGNFHIWRSTGNTPRSICVSGYAATSVSGVLGYWLEN